MCDKDGFKMVNFFDIKDEDLYVLNPYDFEEAIKRIENLTIEDVKDDLKNFQKKQFDFRNYEEEPVYSLKGVKFLTSSKNEDGENEFYILNDLSEYLIADEELPKKNDNNEENEIKKINKITLEIKSQEGGKKQIFLKILVQPENFSRNILNNFIDKSNFEKANKFKNEYFSNLKKNNETTFKLTLKFDMNSLNKIYYNKIKGEYYFDLQSPPIFRTNFFNSNDDENNRNNNYQINKPREENCLFPFRNFNDEISNLKYRHFIIMIQKEIYDTTPKNENDNINFDTNDELNGSLENLFKDRNGEIDKEKYVNKQIIPKIENKDNNNNISYFFHYNTNKDIKRKLKDLSFLKKNANYENEEEKYNDEEAIKLFYQVIALVSENILSYYNGVEFLNNLLKKGKYKDIFKKCLNEEFPIFFNITLTKILDKYQNSLKEKNLGEFEVEMKNTFESLYAQYESEGLEEVLKPSKNEILMRVPRCVITPTYILFTPYVLDQGNRILREFVKSINYSMLCTFKMDNLEEARWNNRILVEYIKFILCKGFNIGEKTFKFFNYSQSQFRNMSCWLLTNPEEILPKIGDFSKIKQVSKYGARISQTLTTTIKTIEIPKDKIDDKINDVERNGYTFSDGVGKMSVVLSERISKKLNLDYIPSCFQGRFLGCKGVWTTMWNDKSGKIYCRPSQQKFYVSPQEIKNYFELCDYSRYIQAYLNRQIIILLSALGIEDRKFEKKLTDYKRKLNDQNFVLSLIHYSEWNQMLRKMNSCGINRLNDRLSRSIIESNLDILYNDVKKKARIYVEEAAYVIGIMDEYGVLEYGEAFLQIRRDDFHIILDKKCTVAKCPCLHPGDIRVLRFRKYNKEDPKTKKYKVFNNYENVIIFPSKGERPHPDECSGSDLDGDNYFVFYDNDLIPQKTIPPMSYKFGDNKNNNPDKPFSTNDVIDYFAEYTNSNSLGLIGDAHLAISDKKGANCQEALNLAIKFSKAVDAPKTGEKIKLDENESPKEFPHYMGKSKKKSYISKNILGKLYDKSCEYISKRIKRKEIDIAFYDSDLKIKGWENYAFLAMLYYRDYFEDLFNLLSKNEISGESVLLTGNNIDNDNSILSKKKHNYDLREKIGNDIHNLFIQNKNNFYDAIKNFLIITGKNKEKKNAPNIDLINIEIYFRNNYNLFASACYMISYNLIEDVLINKYDNETSVKYFCNKFSEILNDNLIMENNYEEITEISEYESENIGIDYYKCNEASYDILYDKINYEKKEIKDLIDKKEKDMENFVKELNRKSIPKQANEENKYRILSFPWCISGQILSYMKFINSSFEI